MFDTVVASRNKRFRSKSRGLEWKFRTNSRCIQQNYNLTVDSECINWWDCLSFSLRGYGLFAQTRNKWQYQLDFGKIFMVPKFAPLDLITPPSPNKIKKYLDFMKSRGGRQWRKQKPSTTRRTTPSKRTTRKQNNNQRKKLVLWSLRIHASNYFHVQ